MGSAPPNHRRPRGGHQTPVRRPDADPDLAGWRRRAPEMGSAVTSAASCSSTMRYPPTTTPPIRNLARRSCAPRHNAFTVLNNCCIRPLPRSTRSPTNSGRFHRPSTTTTWPPDTHCSISTRRPRHRGPAAAHRRAVNGGHRSREAMILPQTSSAEEAQRSPHRPRPAPHRRPLRHAPRQQALRPPDTCCCLN